MIELESIRSSGIWWLTGGRSTAVEATADTGRPRRGRLRALPSTQLIELVFY
jgi:hypothetical protein